MVDWVALLLQDVPEVLTRHYMDYRLARQKFETAYAPNQTIESIFHGLQPHFALRDGEESEKEYLRQLADELLRILLPEVEYQSDCVRWLVREILSCLVLKSLVEILTEPDMINYIVNTLLVDFEPTDEKYEQFLQKAADEMAASDDNFSAFLASLGGPKGSVRGRLTHRSSTPNIKTTDEMVNMLQEAQESILQTPKQSNEHTRISKQTSSLAWPERNDDLLSQRIAGSTGHSVTPPSPSPNCPVVRSVSVPPEYCAPLDLPLQLPSENKSRIIPGQETPFRDQSTWNKPTATRKQESTPSTLRPINQSHSLQGVMSRIGSGLLRVVSVAPVEYTHYMVKSVLIPFSAMLLAFLSFMLALPSKINQASQAMVWIYAELEAPEHTDLEAGIFKLVKEIFYLEERNQVIWRQWEIMGWPLVRTLGGGAIDRLLAHGVYWIFAEPRLVTYIEAGRRALWPDPNSSLPRPRGVDEMEKARKDAERRILRTIPAPLRDTFFGDQGVHHLAAAQEALEPFQNKMCNKHLMYIALDLLLSKVVPELYPERI
ncbi:hypothetical protein BGZ51_001091 [Haplosporangium sp. Z 767]|nr:hypothetical protein BGZ51_001091 [Haplosporangium sp. Z 767]